MSPFCLYVDTYIYMKLYHKYIHTQIAENSFNLDKLKIILEYETYI